MPRSRRLITGSVPARARAGPRTRSNNFLEAGLGVPPPLPDWGAMIADGKQYMFFSPWVITIPGVALFVLVLGINLLGDGVRDLTAPENRS